MTIRSKTFLALFVKFLVLVQYLCSSFVNYCFLMALVLMVLIMGCLSFLENNKNSSKASERSYHPKENNGVDEMLSVEVRH